MGRKISMISYTVRNLCAHNLRGKLIMFKVPTIVVKQLRNPDRPCVSEPPTFLYGR